jgi:hypothetical protein
MAVNRKRKIIKLLIYNIKNLVGCRVARWQKTVFNFLIHCLATCMRQSGADTKYCLPKLSGVKDRYDRLRHHVDPVGRCEMMDNELAGRKQLKLVLIWA